MVTIRAYTTIEQSRKLAEILPLESADMWYSIVDNEAFICLGYHNEYEQIPCWSLASLLGVISNKFKFDLIDNGKSFVLTVGDFETSDKELIDACVAMTKKLYELNLL